VLEDPKRAIPPYDAILLVARKRADDRALIAALRPLVGSIDVTLMRDANLRASQNAASVEEVARWLSDEAMRRGSR
jgi:osmoprotectant transport system substrate-binding protein/osmoprotectant transport system permease protein